jgi:hypothetical protein
MTRLLLVQAFTLPETSRHYLRPADGSKEAQLMNYADLAPLLLMSRGICIRGRRRRRATRIAGLDPAIAIGCC